MPENSLTALSPIDGRYFKQTESLKDYFSEFALIKYRVKVEIEYLIALSTIPLQQLVGLNEDARAQLKSIYKDFSLEDAEEVKNIEKTTNHDVKAVEYFIKNKMKEMGLDNFIEFVHFGLTSQDINNTAFPLMIKDGLENELLPVLDDIKSTISELGKLWNNVPMLARTHGQPASPTRLGKELEVFRKRLQIQIDHLIQIPFNGKFGGATGNFNAHTVTYPDIDWHDFANQFLELQLGIVRSYPTTQIEHYDNLSALFDCLKRINIILIDFCRDIWQYISMNYFSQKINKNEVGSSAMPHKVNPIDFENAEGNLGIANAVLEHLSSKLPISRLQRDLTDSTVLRNVGVPFAHMLISFRSVQKGINKLQLNQSAIENDLNNHWEVVAEGIQNILRRENYPRPYEALKDLTRNNEKITPEVIQKFIESLDVSDEIKSELLVITPDNYTGS